MQIRVTEHKSVGALNPISRAVRVFVNEDYHYGYFVDEHALFELLTPQEQIRYLDAHDVTLDVALPVAQRIVDIGATPFAKPQL